MCQIFDSVFYVIFITYLLQVIYHHHLCSSVEKIVMNEIESTPYLKFNPKSLHYVNRRTVKYCSSAFNES